MTPEAIFITILVVAVGYLLGRSLAIEEVLRRHKRRLEALEQPHLHYRECGEPTSSYSPAIGPTTEAGLYRKDATGQWVRHLQ